MIDFLKRFFLIGFLAAGLSACPQPSVKPDADDPMQNAYAVKDQLILAGKSLNDLYEQEKLRRVNNPDGKQLISDATFDASWRALDESMKVADRMIVEAKAAQPLKE